MSAIEFKC